MEREGTNRREKESVGQQQFLRGHRVTERQAVSWNAIVRNAFGELLFLLVAMGCGNSEQTKRVRDAGSVPRVARE